LIVDKEDTEIPLPSVKGVVLEKIIDYMTYHAQSPAKDIEKPLKSADMREVAGDWDANFVDVEQEMLFELILVRTSARRFLFFLTLG
jgi:S-phase kinase-associated protein 1